MKSMQNVLCTLFDYYLGLYHTPFGPINLIVDSKYDDILNLLGNSDHTHIFDGCIF